MTAESVARQHYLDRRELSDAAGDLAEQAWRHVDPLDLDRSWELAAPDLFVGLSGAQLAAARTADGYADEVLEEQGISAAADAVLAPEALAGVASDGRPLDSLLRNGITTAKLAIAGGFDIQDAMAAGYANLDMLVRTQLVDAGRVADQVALVARPAAEGYIRRVAAGACSRCVVLAGRWYRWNAAFDRHPRCHCVGVPVDEAEAGDLRTNPRAYFDSLSQAEQDKAFTVAGARAIRDGADIGQVVNARRGALGLTPAGGRITAAEARALRGGHEIGRLQTTRVHGRDLYVTTEGTTVRGAAGKVRPRLMPESIYKIAGSDRSQALQLLRRNGYLRDVPKRSTLVRRAPAAAVPAPRVPSFSERIGAAATGGKALEAPTFSLERDQPEAFTVEMYDAVLRYGGMGFHAINSFLRGQGLPRGASQREVDAHIRNLDATMALSKLDRDVVTYRGVMDSTPMFGSRLDGDLTGMEWREDAYMSTTAVQKETEFFSGGSRAGQVPMLLRILSPAGTPAVEVSGLDQEAEILLGRGRRLRVVADRGVGPDGLRHIDAEVLGD